MNGLKAYARIREEQHVGLVLKDLKVKNLDQPHEELLITTNPRYNHYNANEDRFHFEDGLLCKKYFGETGNVKY